MLRQITCPICHSQYLLDDFNRISYCRCCGNMLTVHNAQVDQKKNKGKIVLAVVCVLFFLGLINTGRAINSNTRDNKAETERTSQSKSTAETASSKQSSQTASSRQMNYTVETKSKKDVAAGVTPELKEFLDEYEAIIYDLIEVDDLMRSKGMKGILGDAE